MHLNIVKKLLIFIIVGTFSHFSYAADMRNNAASKRNAQDHFDYRTAKHQEIEQDISDNIELVFKNFLIEIILVTKGDLKYVLDLIAVSKLFYEKITGFEFSDMSLWNCKRKYYHTVLNERHVYSSELTLLSGKRAKKITEQYENYFTLGIKGRILPRYIVEALRDLTINNKLKSKAFAAEKTKGYLNIANGLENTGVKSLSLFVPDPSHIPDIIMLLNKLADSKLESIVLQNVFLSSDHMRALKAEKINPNLKEIGFAFSDSQTVDNEGIENLVKYLKNLTRLNSIIIHNGFNDALWRNITSLFLDKIGTINSLEFRVTPPHDEGFPKLLAKKEIKRLAWHWPEGVFKHSRIGFRDAVIEIAGYVDYIPTLEHICLTMDDYYYEQIGNSDNILLGDRVAMKELVGRLENSGRPIILCFPRRYATEKGRRGWVIFMNFISHELPKNINLYDDFGPYTGS